VFDPLDGVVAQSGGAKHNGRRGELFGKEHGVRRNNSDGR
jgi:hypothetical protein